MERDDVLLIMPWILIVIALLVAFVVWYDHVDAIDGTILFMSSLNMLVLAYMLLYIKNKVI